MRRFTLSLPLHSSSLCSRHQFQLTLYDPPSPPPAGSTTESEGEAPWPSLSGDERLVQRRVITHTPRLRRSSPATPRQPGIVAATPDPATPPRQPGNQGRAQPPSDPSLTLRGTDSPRGASDSIARTILNTKEDVAPPTYRAINRPWGMPYTARRQLVTTTWMMSPPLGSRPGRGC